MTLKSLFKKFTGKAEKPVSNDADLLEEALTPPAAPAPEAPQPAIETTVEVPENPTADAGAIRDALDEMGTRLINAGDDALMDYGMRLQSMREYVSSSPCRFPGYDDVIVQAVNEFEHVCDGCKPEAIKEMLGKLEKALQARTTALADTNRFVLTMEMHYYSMKLIELQGKLNYSTRSLAADQKTIRTYENDLVSEEIIDTLQAQIRATRREQKIINENIVLCMESLRSAVHELNRNGPVRPMDASRALQRMHSSIEEINAAYEQELRNKVSYAAKLDALLEGEAMTTARETAVNNQLAEQRRQRAQLTRKLDNHAAVETSAVPAAEETPAAPAAESEVAQSEPAVETAYVFESLEPVEML